MNNRSLIGQLTKEQLEKLIDESTSLSNIIYKLGINVSQYQINEIRAKIKNEGISLEEVESKFSITKVKFLTNKNTPIKDCLVENSNFKPRNRKKELFGLGLLKNECYDCGIGDTWNGKPIVLQFDHINGNNKDNRIENLQVLCPNCHSQTKTFAGRNSPLNKLCSICNNNLAKRSHKFCSCCYENNVISKVILKFGSIIELQSVLNNHDYKYICEKYDIRYSPLKNTVKFLRENKLVSTTRGVKPVTLTKKCTNCLAPIKESHKFCSKNCFYKMQRDSDFLSLIPLIVLLKENGFDNSVISNLIKAAPSTIRRYFKRYKTEATPIIIHINSIPINVISVIFVKYNSYQKVAKILKCKIKTIKEKIKKENIELYNSYSPTRVSTQKECPSCQKMFTSNNKSNRTHCSIECNKESTNKKYKTIIELMKQNYSINEVATKLNFSRRSVNNVFLKYKRNLLID